MVKGLFSQHAVPLLVLGTSASAQLLRTKSRQRRLSQPFGPHKLAKAIFDTLFLSPVSAVSQDANGENQKRGSLKRSYSTMSTSLSPYRIIESPDPPGPAQCRPPSPRTSEPIVGQPSLSLLLVDDNDINLKIIATYIRKLACRYATACNGLEAVERYQKAYGEGMPFDVVLMDVSMPVMDGFEATREIRTFECRTKIPKPSRIIALTGLTSEKSQEEALASGVNLFLTKPVQLKKLKLVLGLT